MALEETAFDLVRDLADLLTIVSRMRASGDPHAFLHPGGLQWLLRWLGHRPFTVRQWRDRAEFAAAIVDDGGYDPRTRTVEIEPLGTHPEYRKLGLGRAIVDEVFRRAAERDARSVLVWGSHGNDAALHLYTSAGLRPRRTLREYRRSL